VLVDVDVDVDVVVVADEAVVVAVALVSAMLRKAAKMRVRHSLLR